MNLQKKGFTLVELIVVITILAILGTVAFVSFQGYSRQARDSVRISNYSNINKTLDLYEVQAGKYPKPQNSNTVRYAGVDIWEQGVIGERIQSLINVAGDLSDIKFGSEISYSVTTSGKNYEIAGVFEENQLSQNIQHHLTDQIYAATDVVAYIGGNYNSKYLRTSTGGETHIISIPSLILNTRGVDQEVQVGVENNNFVIAAKKTIPGSFIEGDFNSETVPFTPRLLYQGTDCSPLNEVDYYNLEAGLKQSYGTGIFQSINKYDQYQDGYIHPFYLEENALLLRKQLHCSSNTPFLKSNDVLPLTCVNEDGTFEGFSPGALISNSCLHTYEGDSDWIIEDGSGSGASKAIRNIPAGEGETTAFIYNMVLNKAANLTFDYKLDYNEGTASFYINGVKYEKWGGSGIQNGTYQTYTTTLLPAGNYEFKFETYVDWASGAYSNLFLDNILIDETCIDGGATCGWDLNFEDSSDNPFDIFVFSGDVTTPWTRVTDSSNGTYAIKNPPLDQGETTYITLNKTLSQSQKLNFDYKLDYNQGTAEFYINGAKYEKWGGSGMGNGTYQAYTTSLLPPGDYEFKFKINLEWASGAHADLSLDNFNFSCIGGGAGCGWDLDFEDGISNPYELFTFDGAAKTPWTRVGVTDSSNGVYAIKNPLLIEGDKTYIIFNQTLTAGQTLNFDYKLSFFLGRAKLYIDSVQVKHWGEGGDTSGLSAYQTYLSPVLGAGTYEFKIEVEKDFSVGSKAIFHLDNITITP
ncbi:type II secretion system protein [Candidatus Gracilibacteria bacterium 28_42_T64]|nr:type II secretion system protein [Candidatus Gracilibacteria bacterium 28_42_T64]